MTKNVETFERITIYYNDDEREAVLDLMNAGDWRVKHLGPVIKKLRVVPGQFECVAERLITATSTAVAKFRMRRPR